tara:strand:- start:4354 stop:4512 length:159 start_codon:yes stop_codon:yes gene_type:complete
MPFVENLQAMLMNLSVFHLETDMDKKRIQKGAGSQNLYIVMLQWLVLSPYLP